MFETVMRSPSRVIAGRRAISRNPVAIMRGVEAVPPAQQPQKQHRKDERQAQGGRPDADGSGRAREPEPDPDSDAAQPGRRARNKKKPDAPGRGAEDQRNVRNEASAE